MIKYYYNKLQPTQEMTNINTEQYIAEFERSLFGTYVNKGELLSILESRLNGSFHVDCITCNNKSFDFTKNLTESQKYYLETFDMYYYKTLQKPDPEYVKTIVEPILCEIKKNYDNIIHFMKVKPDNIKQALMSLNNYGMNTFNLNTILEFSCIVSKKDELQSLIVKHYKNIIDPKFNINNFIDMNNPIYFREFYGNIKRYIADIYNNKIQEILKSSEQLNDLQVKKIREYQNKMVTVPTLLNGIFWIVYASEFAFIDDIQSIYYVEEELLNNYQEKMTEWFTYESEVMTENGIPHVSKRNIFEETMEQFDELEMKFQDILEKKSEELRDANIDSETFEIILEEEVDKFVNKLTTDAEEQQFYKTQLGINITLVMLIHKMENFSALLKKGST